jgi:hypothetical protein
MASPHKQQQRHSFAKTGHRTPQEEPRFFGKYSVDWVLQTLRSLQLEVAALKAAVSAAPAKNSELTLSTPRGRADDLRQQNERREWTVDEKDALKDYKKVQMGERKWWSTSAKCEFKFRNENIVNATEDVICHLVGGDLGNSRGAALALANKFGHPGAGAKLEVGDIRVQQVENHEIWHLVSKPWAKQQKFSNPGAFYLNHLRALIALKDRVKERGLKQIAITPLGSNCNRIAWDYTEAKLTEIFADLEVTFVVYCLPPNFSGVGAVAAKGTRSKAAHRRPESRTECLEVATGLARGGCPQQPPLTNTYRPPGKPTPFRYVEQVNLECSNSFSPLEHNATEMPDEREHERAYAEKYLKSLMDKQTEDRGSQRPVKNHRLIRDLEKMEERLEEENLSKSLSGGGGKTQPPSPHAESSKEPPQTNLLNEVNSDLSLEADPSPLLLHAPEINTTAHDEMKEAERSHDQTDAMRDELDGQARQDELQQGCVAGGGSPNKLPPLDTRSDHQPPRHAPTLGVGTGVKLRPESSTFPSPEIPDVLIVQERMIAEMREMRRSLDKLRLDTSSARVTPNSPVAPHVTVRRSKNKPSPKKTTWK